MCLHREEIRDGGWHLVIPFSSNLALNVQANILIDWIGNMHIILNVLKEFL